MLEAEAQQPGKEDMMIGLLLYLLGDLVFDTAQSMGQRYEKEFTRYMEDRGLVGPAEKGDGPAR